MIGRELRAFRGEHVAEEINHRLNVFLAAFIGIERLLTLFGHGKLIGLKVPNSALALLRPSSRVISPALYARFNSIIVWSFFSSMDLPRFSRIFVAISSHFVLIGPPACQSIGSRAELSLNSIDG